MLIKALSVEGVGRFVTPMEVNGFGDGVNVLAAGNEVGKSTLFRAIRTCLFSRHDSKTQDIRDLGSDGSQLPATVQITFEQNGRTYVIRKSFLRSPSASLTENGREIARSKQADEAIWDTRRQPRQRPCARRWSFLPVVGRAGCFLRRAGPRSGRILHAQHRHRIRSRGVDRRRAGAAHARRHQR